MSRIAVAIALVSACTSSKTQPTPGPPTAPTMTVPRVHVMDGVTWPDFDQGYCRGSMVPEQDPVFPTIKRSRFQIDPATDLVTIPADWMKEAKETRVPQLERAAAERLPRLLGKAVELVGRGFDHHDFDYFFYLCPYFGGGTASAKVYPMFQYLRAAVGDLQWPDWLFTDQYLFHEVLHNYVIERIDYTKGTPILNAVYAALAADTAFLAKGKAHGQGDDAFYIGTAMTHIHVYAIMTATLRALGEEERLQTIRHYETGLPAAHPSYVKAWEYVIAIENDPAAMAAILAEVK
jgi:hypothetical protein